MAIHFHNHNQLYTYIKIRSINIKQLDCNIAHRNDDINVLNGPAESVCRRYRLGFRFVLQSVLCHMSERIR